MSRVHIYLVQVEFGDCDPAGIVFFPNFLRWIDAAGRALFIAAGVPPWRDTERSSGIIGTPLIDVHARFMLPASYGDRLAIESSIRQWRNRSFVMHHRVCRGGDVLAECDEVRVFARRVAADPARIEAVVVPAEIRELCERA
jgi:4-hydroxybenzoyl-CoA thioesterase